ncbi:hypothetical protein RF11_14419 [Thelohanellus kitauei]|uniref:Uncharacterized protein n=1 Tax=Thelohanellus kitauei TaxID=669202 RepID=A0A0C2J807_THEKT|nr:hypothetical protein RF11_14419 [Thelohanellus kitauei]
MRTYETAFDTIQDSNNVYVLANRNGIEGSEGHNFVTVPYFEVDWTHPHNVLLVIGLDGAGLHWACDLSAQHTVKFVTVPQCRGYRELCDSSAVAVIQFEAQRQYRTKLLDN